MYIPSVAGTKRLAAHVQKTNTHAFVEIRLSLTDLDLTLAHSTNGPEHLILVDTDAVMGNSTSWASSDPDTFAWIEVCLTRW